MSVEVLGALFLGLGYLALLWGCAMAVERGWIPLRISRHPAVYTLALGVYASAWAIYGSVELAANVGFGYLAYYLGAAGAFLLAPVLLVPIQRITRTYQLASLADLFAFRFRSRWAGTLVTGGQSARGIAIAGHSGQNHERGGQSFHPEPGWACRGAYILHGHRRVSSDARRSP